MQAAEAGSCEPYQHHDSIPVPVFEQIKPIYIRLTDKALLQRFLQGATQNRNECLNGLIWQYCPKETWCGASTVETAAALAVAWFNDGADSVQELYRTMSLPVGTHTARVLAALNVQRIQDAERKAGKEEKGPGKGGEG